MFMGCVQAATMSWIGGDGAWEDGANWQTNDDPPVNRVPVNGDTIRPNAAGVTITYSATTGTQNLVSSTIWQDSSATTGFLQTGGDLTVYQLYLAKLKTDSASTYTVSGGSLFVNRNLNMAWSSSGAIDARFVQTGGSVRIGDAANEGLWMSLKSSGQGAYYDLQGGDFEARIVAMGAGGANSNTVFTQSAGTTAVINEQLRMGQYAGTTGSSIYHLDGGTLTIEAALNPFLFTQPGAPVYFDFDGGALNLKGTWDFNTLTGIANSDFRVAGVAATAGDLAFDPVTIGSDAYTQITVIPEPSSAGLLGLAGLALAARRRR